MILREITENDFDGLMRLYTHLHESEIPAWEGEAVSLWHRILSDENYHIIVAEENGQIVSSCTCVVIPNLTRGLRPYALVENVVTDESFRGRGLATACLAYVRDTLIKSILPALGNVFSRGESTATPLLSVSQDNWPSGGIVTK